MHFPSNKTEKNTGGRAPISLSHHVHWLWKLALPIPHLKAEELLNNASLPSSGKEKIHYRFPPGLGGNSPDSDAE